MQALHCRKADNLNSFRLGGQDCMLMSCQSDQAAHRASHLLQISP